jgi:hypothetical protein
MDVKRAVEQLVIFIFVGHLEIKSTSRAAQGTLAIDK